MENKDLIDDLLVYFDNKIGGDKEDTTFSKVTCADELLCRPDEISQALDELIRKGYILANEDGDKIVVEMMTEKGMSRLEEIA